MAFNIVRDDIAGVTCDAVVNTGNADVRVGKAAYTEAFDQNARYIIHTAEPLWTDGEHGEKDEVRRCYESCLSLAKELGCESIAIPLIAAETDGFPKGEALRIAISSIENFLSEDDMDITLAVFDESSFVLSDTIFSGVDAFIDEKYVPETSGEECFFEVEEPAPEPVKKNKSRIFFGSEKKAKSRFKADVCFGSSAESVAMASPMPMAAAGARKLEDIVSQLGESWQESLFRLIDEKGYTDVEVYKRANVNRKLFSKIRSNADYQPKKNTAIAFALALKLNLDETKDLIGRAGYAFSPGSKFDLIIEYFIEQEVFDIYTINLALFDHHQPLLGE